MNTNKNKKLLYLGNQPVSNRYKRKKDQYTMKVNLKLVQEHDTGLIKLSNPVNPKYLMPKVSWLTYNEPEEHLDRVVTEINNKFFKSSKIIVGGISFKDDTTLERFRSKGHQIWRLKNKKDLKISESYGVESIQAALNIYKAKKIIKKYKPADLLIVRHIWEHTFNQDSFASALKYLIKDGGIIFFEIPDCSKQLSSYDYTMIWEEHLLYYTYETIVPSLSKFDFEIVYKKKVNYPNEPSLILCVKVKSKASKKISKKNRNELLKLGENYKNQFFKKKYLLHNLLKNYKRMGFKIGIFGAGHLSTAFISFFKIEKYILHVFDDNKKKQKLFLPGSKIKIVPSSYINHEKKLMILLSVNLTSEYKIIKKLKNISNNELHVKSIFPLSKVSILNEK
jgi:hypothetical protein